MRALAGVSVLLTAVLTLAGCGGEETAVGGAAAGVVPADVAVYVAGDTDFEGEEWQQAEELLQRFPDGEEAIRDLLAEIEADEGVDFEQDVEPALGPEVAVVVLDFESGEPAVVALTQPADEQKLQDLLARGDEPTVSEEVDGWTVVSDEQSSIDAYKEARGGETLADSERFEQAFEGLDGGLVSVYVNGDALQRALEQDPSFDPASVAAVLPDGEVPEIGVTLAAEDDGARMDGNFVFAEELEEGELVPPPYEAQLPEEVPAGVLAYLSFNDFESQISRLRDAIAQSEPDFEQQLGQIEGLLGVSLEEDIAPLFAAESALYVRPGSPIPEVTLLSVVADEEAALRTLDDLFAGIHALGGLPAPERTEVAGVDVRQVTIPPVTLFYGAFEGKLVVTTAREGVADLVEDGDRFADDEAYADARERAGLPDETTGFAYANLEEVVPLLFDYADAGGETVPPEARANADPLGSFVAYGTQEGNTVKFSGFLGVE